jgi:hypothetical protein
MNRYRREFLAAVGAVATLAALSARGSDVGKMKIGVIGSGQVGSALGTVWVKRGHEVMFSSRHLARDKALAAELGAGARAGTPREAAGFGVVVMISVPYGALPDVAMEVGDLVRGKVVIDTCNPFPWRDGKIAEWARAKGAGLATAELLPGARLVRTFNAIAAARMGAAHETPERVGMPIAGDDAEALALASGLVREIGYEPVLIGGLAKGRYLMPGTALAGEHSPAELRRIAATLD